MSVELGFTVANESPGTVVRATVEEALSELYSATVVVARPADAPSASSWLGRRAALTLAEHGVTRGLRGVVTRAEDLGRTAVARYARVQVEPTLALLGQRRDVRVFQDLPVVEIVRAVLQHANAYPGARLEVPTDLLALAPREYCVQFRETDLAFVRRLLEEEGIPFSFSHDNVDGETLVLGGASLRWSDVPTSTGRADIPVLDEGAGTASEEAIERFDVEASLRPTGVALADHDFTRPGAPADLSPSHPSSPGERAHYDAPGRFHFESWDEGAHAYRSHDGARQARIRYEALQHGSAQAQGTGLVVGFRPGAAFRPALTDHGERWLITRVTHEAHAWGDVAEDPGAFARLVRAGERGDSHAAGTPGRRYGNRFTCAPAGQPWRPARVTPRPLVHGVQTATVVGPAGEQVHTDAHGRVKVRFHWDRDGRAPERASCWVRVAQVWAGAGFGGMFVPRVGMEVVVSFLDGDPDRPLITGCVYNGENRPPWALPAEKTRGGVRTASSPGGGFNELRFEDRQGEEQVYVRAERDLDALVQRDRTVTVQRNSSSVVQGREKSTVGKDRVTRVLANDSLTVSLNQDCHVQGPLGATLKVDETWRLIADRSAVIECGDTRVVLQPGSITLHAREIRIAGGETVDIQAPLVRINCSESLADAQRSARAGGGREQLRGTADGGVVARLRASIDPRRTKAALSSALGSALSRLGLAAPVERALKSLGEAVVGEVVDAGAAGRRPQGHRVVEHSLAAAVNLGVDQVFGPMCQAPMTREHRVLGGVVREARDVAASAATHAVLTAADVHAGMSKDSAWHLVAERHADGLRAALWDVAVAAADAVHDAALQKVRRAGPIPRTDALVQQASRAAIARCLPALMAR